MAATVMVCRPPAITGQPQTQNTSRNAVVTLTVTAEGDNLQYQWYRGSKGDLTTPIGDNTCRLTVTAIETQAYWVRVTGTCGTGDSETALVSVFPTITQQPVGASVCGMGETATFSVAATGAQGYRWYRRVPGGNAELIGAGTPFATPVPVTDTKYWAEAWSGNAVTPTNQVNATITPRATLTSFEALSYSTNQYTLTAAVAVADRSSVGYRFYQGSLGDTSRLLADSTTNYKTVTPPYRPITYWVRVYRLNNPTRCFADAALTIH